MPDAINHVLVTLDSCRWDSFERARLPLLKSGQWRQCWTHATFTMAAHQAFFAGKLPHCFDGSSFFDTAAAGKRKRQVQQQIWRLANPESERASHVTLDGTNIKDGFRRQGYTTIGTGAMNWFDPTKPAAGPLTSDFDHYRYFPNAATRDGRNLEQQVDWLLEVVARARQPYFLFLNVGETHHRYSARGHQLEADWGDAVGCAAAQNASLEFADTQLARLFAGLSDYFAVVCGDHGDCWGEDGLWGHGFYHPKVMEVPMAVLGDSRLRKQAASRWWPFN